MVTLTRCANQQRCPVPGAAAAEGPLRTRHQPATSTWVHRRSQRLEAAAQAARAAAAADMQSSSSSSTEMCPDHEPSWWAARLDQQQMPHTTRTANTILHHTNSTSPTRVMHKTSHETDNCHEKASSSVRRVPSRSMSIALLALVLAVYMVQPAVCCSSRSTPKPRPPSQSSIRPNITFQTYACPPAYAAWYCLNGATCFTVKIAESILYNCECADGYMGQRCEFKDLDGTYLPTREHFLGHFTSSSTTGQVVFGAVGLVVSFAAVSAFITHQRNRNRIQRIRKESSQQQYCVEARGREQGFSSASPDYPLHPVASPSTSSPQRNFHQHCLRQIACHETLKREQQQQQQQQQLELEAPPAVATSTPRRGGGPQDLDDHDSSMCHVSIIGSSVSYALEQQKSADNSGPVSFFSMHPHPDSSSSSLSSSSSCSPQSAVRCGLASEGPASGSVRRFSRVSAC